jgi:predicted ester cyclase
MGEARDVVDRFYGYAGDGNLEGATSCFAEDCMTTTPAGSFNPQQHEQFLGAFKNALPDAHMEIVRAVESGNEIFVSGRFKGTHQGDLVSPQGTLPASGNQLDLPYADYFRVEGGKIVEHEVVWDSMGMMMQLGAGPPQ